MSTVKLCGACVICLCAVLCVKNLKEGFLPLVRISSVIIFIGAALYMLVPVVDFAGEVIKESGISEYGKIIFKAIGIAYLTNITSEICRDCGENTLSEAIENVGRIELLLLSLPLLSEILTFSRYLLSW